MTTDDPDRSIAQQTSTPERPLGTVCVASIDSTALLQGRDAVFIVHRGELYRLHATRQGKLILTK